MTNRESIHTERLHVSIDPETKAGLVALARRRRMALSELIREIARRELEREGVAA